MGMPSTFTVTTPFIHLYNDYFALTLETFVGHLIRISRLRKNLRRVRACVGIHKSVWLALSQCWPMRSVVRTSFPRDMDHITSAIAMRRAFMIPMFYDFSSDDRHSPCKSSFSVISSCSDNMFHRPQFTAKMCRGCSDQV